MKISIGLNAVLLAGLIVSWVNSRRNSFPALPVEPKSAPPAPAVAGPAPPAARQVAVETRPFRWSQLVSTNDYRVYVANLRASGCPEQTVEDIVRGDANRAFAEMHRRLGIDGTTTGPWSGRSQMRLVASLLGQEPAEPASPTPAPAKREQPPLLTPLVLQAVNLKALGLNAEQAQMVDSVRQDFLSQTGGPIQDKNDPAYQQRWRRAQRAADNMLLAQLGNEVYTKYQLMAYQTALVNQAQTGN